MRHAKIAAAAMAILVIAPHGAFADDEDSIAVAELGASGETALNNGGGSAIGPTASIEWHVAPDWLSIETGVSRFSGHGHADWDADLLFKKPFQLTDKLEFMIGAGPSWSHGPEGDSYGMEASADFMLWPWDGSRLGFYAEPSYGYNFAHDHEQSLGFTVGLLFAIP